MSVTSGNVTILAADVAAVIVTKFASVPVNYILPPTRAPLATKYKAHALVSVTFVPAAGALPIYNVVVLVYVVNVDAANVGCTRTCCINE